MILHSFSWTFIFILKKTCDLHSSNYYFVNLVPSFWNEGGCKQKRNSRRQWQDAMFNREQRVKAHQIDTCHGWAGQTPDSPLLLTHRYSGSGSLWPISQSPISLSRKKRGHLFAPLRKVCFVTWDVQQNSNITPNESSPFLTSSSWVWIDWWLARRQETMTKVAGEVRSWLSPIAWQRWQVVALTVIHCMGPPW